jgi:hypothetical protein
MKHEWSVTNLKGLGFRVLWFASWKQLKQQEICGDNFLKTYY